VHIARLSLSHFRSHRRTDLDIDARPVAIHGPNGAGKTNLIEAVSLLSPGRGLRRATTADLARRPDGIGWRIGATLQGPGLAHEIDTRAEPGAARATRIDGKAAAQTALGHLVRILWLSPAMDRLWIEGAEGRRRFLDRITLSFFPDHAAATLGYEKAMRDRNRLLRDHVTDARWFDGLEARMAECGAQIIHARQAAVARVSAAQSDAQTSFPAARLRIDQGAVDEPAGPLCGGDAPPDATKAAMRDALTAALAAGRRDDYRAGRTRFGPHRADLEAVYAAKDMDAAQCSTGEQKALLISLVLANARALAAETGAAPILLLDEVAAHLDAARRAALYDELLGLQGQAWLTGTGADLFEDLGARAQHIAVRETAGESRIELVGPHRGNHFTER
jgi:DNA replication and repair protein RecF